MKVKASKRISNGYDAEGPIPWQVAVYKYYEPYNNWGSLGCGASVIDEYTILSAAHCFRKEGSDGKMITDADPDKYFLILGLLKKSEANAKARFEIENILIHPRFKVDDILFGYDIAILKTKKRISFTLLPKKLF